MLSNGTFPLMRLVSPMLLVAPSNGVPQFRKVKTVPELLSTIGQLPTVLRQAVRSFRGKVDKVRSRHFRFDSIPVPLDIRRYNVTMAP